MEDDTETWTGWMKCHVCGERWITSVQIDPAQPRPIMPQKCLNGHLAGYPQEPYDPETHSPESR